MAEPEQNPHNSQGTIPSTYSDHNNDIRGRHLGRKPTRLLGSCASQGLLHLGHTQKRTSVIHERHNEANRGGSLGREALPLEGLPPVTLRAGGANSSGYPCY